jgi:hypothetical protein
LALSYGLKAHLLTVFVHIRKFEQKMYGKTNRTPLSLKKQGDARRVSLNSTPAPVPTSAFVTPVTTTTATPTAIGTTATPAAINTGQNGSSLTFLPVGSDYDDFLLRSRASKSSIAEEESDDEKETEETEEKEEGGSGGGGCASGPGKAQADFIAELGLLNPELYFEFLEEGYFKKSRERLQAGTGEDGIRELIANGKHHEGALGGSVVVSGPFTDPKTGTRYVVATHKDSEDRGANELGAMHFGINGNELYPLGMPTGFRGGKSKKSPTKLVFGHSRAYWQTKIDYQASAASVEDDIRGDVCNALLGAIRSGDIAKGLSAAAAALEPPTATGSGGYLAASLLGYDEAPVFTPSQQARLDEIDEMMGQFSSPGSNSSSSSSSSGHSSGSGCGSGNGTHIGRVAIAGDCENGSSVQGSGLKRAAETDCEDNGRPISANKRTAVAADGGSGSHTSSAPSFQLDDAGAGSTAAEESDDDDDDTEDSPGLFKAQLENFKKKYPQWDSKYDFMLTACRGFSKWERPNWKCTGQVKCKKTAKNPDGKRDCTNRGKGVFFRFTKCPLCYTPCPFTARK